MITDAMFHELVWKLVGLLTGITMALAGLGYLLFRGFWAKTVQPLVVAEIQTFLSTAVEQARHKEVVKAELEAYHRDQATVVARDKAIATELQRIKNTPQDTEARQTEIKRVVDDQIRRDDGLVHLELNKRIKTAADDQAAALKEFRLHIAEELAPLKGSYERLVKIESMLHTLLKVTKFPGAAES